MKGPPKEIHPKENPLTRQFTFFGPGPRGSVPLQSWQVGGLFKGLKPTLVMVDDPEAETPFPLWTPEQFRAACGIQRKAFRKNRPAWSHPGVPPRKWDRSTRPFVVRYTWWRRIWWAKSTILIVFSMGLIVLLSKPWSWGRAFEDLWLRLTTGAGL